MKDLVFLSTVEIRRKIMNLRAKVRKGINESLRKIT